ARTRREGRHQAPGTSVDRLQDGSSGLLWPDQGVVDSRRPAVALLPDPRDVGHHPLLGLVVAPLADSPMDLFDGGIEEDVEHLAALEQWPEEGVEALRRVEGVADHKHGVDAEVEERA